MSLDPLLGGAATPVDPLNSLPNVLGEDAVAFAPEIVSDDAVAEPGLLPEEALPVVVPEDPRTQLERLKLADVKIDRIYQAAHQFNGAIEDGRSIDELTLGLLWLSEGGAKLTITLDPGDPDFGPNFTRQISRLIVLRSSPAETHRAWRITNIALWGFGLDDIIKVAVLDPRDVIDKFTFANAEARWKRRLLEHGDWTHDVPFRAVNGSTIPTVVTSVGVVNLSFRIDEAVGFLVAVAARFTKQLWALPAELALRGITLSTDSVAEIPLVEPILAYMCYLSRAPRAAGLWEALIFLRDFCNEVVLAAPTSSGTGYDLVFVIAVLNKWLGPLRDRSEFGLTAILRDLVNDSTATLAGGPKGRDLLADVANRADWDPIPGEAELDPDGKALLELLVDAWLVYAKRCAVDLHGLPPGELFFQGADPAISPQLFPSELFTTGFGARNYGERFQTATQAPLGSTCTRAFDAPPTSP
jgi:hypothetical protein